MGWAERANRQSRVNNPNRPPKPEPERAEKPMPRGFAQLGARKAKGPDVAPVETEEAANT